MGSQVVSFSIPQPIPERSAGRPKVLGLICTHPALLPLDTVISSARAGAERSPKATSTRIVGIFIDYPPIKMMSKRRSGFLSKEQFADQKDNLTRGEVTGI